MNSLDGHTFCTLCSQYVPEGLACSDPDCPVLDADGDMDDTTDDVEPVNFHKLEDLREYDYDSMGRTDWYDPEDSYDDGDNFEEHF